MKASYRWLRALLPSLDASPREVAHRLTHAGLEVEGLSSFGAGLESVVVAVVRRIEPHSARSGLRLVTVDRGGGHEQRVVCGASNVPEPGGLVALAPLGTHLAACGLTIAPREIGGVPSEGMLCSESELGLLAEGAAASEGILVLPHGAAEAGTSLAKAVPATTDTIFEIGVTPNRPDALGHVGLARELGALFELPFSVMPPEAPSGVAAGHISDLASVVVEDYERCPHYGASAVVDVTIGASPNWLRYRLASLGVRPISNVVDITNLVMLEFGHPMHAFDLDLVGEGRIVVRRARAGEQMVTLDGVTRKLDADDLLICDGRGPVALAGVMGGANSEISAKTKRVLLECAYFAPRGVRRSSRRHGLHTEASHRFERGVDPQDTADVLAHAGALISQLAGGAAVRGAIHAVRTPPVPAQVTLASARLDSLLGVKVPFPEALSILQRLGFATRTRTASEPARAAGELVADVTVPTHRPDVSREEDLIEEVARVRGLDSIPTVLPAIRPQPPRATFVLENAVRDAAVALGLSEAITYGFASPKDLENVGAPPSPVRLANPLAEERSVMRTSLLPGMLEVVARAFRRGQSEARLFGVGTCFFPSNGPLPDERRSFLALLAGRRHAYLAKPEAYDVYDAKGIACEIAERVLGRPAQTALQPDASRSRFLHPRAAQDVFVAGQLVGRLGLVHPLVLSAWEIATDSAVVVELDLAAFAKLGREPRRFSPIPKLPAVTRDMAFVVHEDVGAGEVEKVIRAAAGELCESVELFDIFRGRDVPEHHRSLAFHVVYRDPRAASAPSEARTLTDKEVDERHQAATAHAHVQLGATLRT